MHSYRYCVSSALFTCSSPIQYLIAPCFFLHLSFLQAVFSSCVFVLWSEDRSRQARRSSQRTLSSSLHLTFRRLQNPEPRSLEEHSTKSPSFCSSISSRRSWKHLFVSPTLPLHSSHHQRAIALPSRTIGTTSAYALDVACKHRFLAYTQFLIPRLE